MKKVIISLALLLSAGSVFAQSTEDKAKAKAEAAALKAAQKEAKSQMAEAQKIWDALNAKLAEKKATEDEIISECKKGQDLITKAIKSGLVDPKKASEAYKLSGDLALQPHNLLLAHASQKEPFDTVYFVDNLRILTDGLHNEIVNTKVTKGEAGNEGYVKAQKMKLSQCGVYYIYAAQFMGEIKDYKRALNCYDFAMKFKSAYPEVAADVKLPIEDAQIAYYAYHTAHEAKMYDVMDKYFDQAMQFADGAEGVKQTKIMTFLERGDTTGWANYLHAETVKNPEANQDYVQMLLAYYQKKGKDKMNAYADEILSSAPELYIANYGKAYILFSDNKYNDAFKYYQKCTELKPDQYDSWYQCGLCKYRDALELNNTISSFKNQQKAKEMLEKTKKLFGDAIPFFEKARECAPDEPMKWAYELKQCYTVIGQAAKAAEMSKLTD